MITEEEAREAASNLDAAMARYRQLYDTGKGLTRVLAEIGSYEQSLVLFARQELARREPRRVESEKVESVFVSELLDDMGVPSTAFGGECDAEVRLNIYERIRMARRQLSRKSGKEGGGK